MSQQDTITTIVRNAAADIYGRLFRTGAYLTAKVPTEPLAEIEARVDAAVRGALVWRGVDPAQADNTVIVHFVAGEISAAYHVIGDGVRLFIVDDNCRNDRVFEYTRRGPASIFAELIPDGTEIGSPQDARHAAVSSRINAALDGRPRLSVVEPEE